MWIVIVGAIASIKYQLEHPNEKVISVFVCHNELSEVAKTFAKK